MQDHHRSAAMAVATAIAAMLTFALHPSRAEEAPSLADMNICEVIASGVSEDLWSGGEHSGTTFANRFMIFSGVFDADNDGIADVVAPRPSPVSGGGMSISPLFSFVEGPPPSNTWSAEEERLYDEYFRWAWSTWWMPFKDRWYRVLFSEEGNAHPVGVTYYAAGRLHIACVFENDVVEYGWRTLPTNPTPYEREVCSNNARDLPDAVRATEDLPPEAITAIEETLHFDEVRQNVSWGELSCRDTFCDVTHIDFDNDGEEDRIVRTRAQQRCRAGLRSGDFTTSHP